MQDVTVIKPKDALPPFSELSKEVQVGALYEHYSGKRYEVLAVARYSEDLVEQVVYKALYGSNDVWVRPLEMFLEKVTKGGEEIPRFKKIS